MTPSPAPTPAPEPTPQHHFNLELFLRALVAVAPAVVSPFIKNPNSQAIFQAEVPIAEALAKAALGQ